MPRVIAPTYWSGAGSVGTSSTTVLLANQRRKFLLFSNLHATATIYLNILGGLATATPVAGTQQGGVPVGPGQTFLLANGAPGGAITAVSTLASTPFFVVEE